MVGYYTARSRDHPAATVADFLTAALRMIQSEAAWSNFSRVSVFLRLLADGPGAGQVLDQVLDGPQEHHGRLVGRKGR